MKDSYGVKIKVESEIDMFNCKDCKFCGYDPDGLYCGHKRSTEVSGGFGRSLTAAREEICTNDKPLFELANEKTLKFRGRL